MKKFAYFYRDGGEPIKAEIIEEDTSFPGYNKITLLVDRNDAPFIDVDEED